MKRLLLLLTLIITVQAQAQYQWDFNQIHPGRYYIAVYEIGRAANGDLSWEVKGMVATYVLDSLSLPTIGSGTSTRGFFSFSGESETLHPLEPVFDWPPSLIDEEMVYYPYRNVFYYNGGFDPGFCNCDCPEAITDTSVFLEGMGLWWDNPAYSPNIWGVNNGDLRYAKHIVSWIKQPCPPTTGDWKYVYDPLYFTDSTYSPLSDDVVISGNSPLYLKATTIPEHPASLSVIVYLAKSREDSIVANMTFVDTLHAWIAKIPSIWRLRPESYGVVEAYSTNPQIYDKSFDRVSVALPRILLYRDNTVINNVFIQSDSMKIKDDVKATVLFWDDSSNYINPKNLIYDVGYKYKSKWTANSNQTPSLQKPYYRQYPIDSLYKWWNKSSERCAYTFNRDSLYAVGGSLSILAKGALKPVEDIDNSFFITSDSFLHHDTLRTDSISNANILIDHDPPNSLFLDSLQYDIIRAIAWREYAGSNDSRHCHFPSYNSPWNHYWDDRVYGADTCHDSKMPCENANDSSTATGIMQFLRGDWENIFNGTDDSTAPAGNYYICSWDSLAWSWEKCIHNGKYIYFTVNFYHMYHPVYNPQRNWDSLYFPASDYTPDRPNKEDLAAYGYNVGWPSMIAIRDSTSWVKKVMNKSYVVSVRKYKDTKPWNQ